MGLFGEKRREPVVRQSDSYDLEIPEGYHAKKINEGQFKIEKDTSIPINGTGKPINQQPPQD